MFKWRTKWQHQADVVVVGSGAAGLTAAVTAHQEGASVLLLEKSGRVGGTCAVSGGVVWVPNNHHMPGVGIPDSREDALTYLRRIADGRTEDELLETFIDRAPEMAKYLEQHTPVRFAALARYPDYHPELEGGRPGGRSLETGLFDTRELGPWASKLRRSPIFGGTPMTVAEATEWGVFANPLNVPYAKLGQRYREGFVCYGGSLAGRLLRGCLDRQIEPMLEVGVTELLFDEGRVSGVKARKGGDELLLGARKGVVLASGGFEWDPALTRRFLSGTVSHPNSPPISHGDGLRMAMAAGADLGNMSEAWWCPSVVVPGEQYDGVQLNRGEFAIRALPHSIIVNRYGRRFVNEAANYNDMMKPFFDWDAAAYDRPNQPAWLVVDQQFLKKYLLVTAVPGMPVPDWLVRAETLDALAVRIGVEAKGLRETVARFNTFAATGVDEEFRRGESIYDHFYGDVRGRSNPNLGTLEEAPFYALQVFPGAIGTKGGPKIDVHARVRHVTGGPIPGLYAAGNVAAGITGPGYPGAGSTIGTAMTWGYIAARHAAAA